MADAAKLTAEKTQLFRDVKTGKIPKRVPFNAALTLEFAIEYAGYDVKRSLWDTENIEAVYDRICRDFPSDLFPIRAPRFPSFYQILGSRPIVMSSSGFMQHPDVEGMSADDYDAFIASPYDCLLETILPRLYPELDAPPAQRALVFAKAMRAYQDETNTLVQMKAKMTAKYGYSTIPAGQSSAMTEAPYDFLADFLRGFRGISSDIRRRPEKVIAACEAVTPLLIKKGLPPVPDLVDGQTFIPLHMAPYMREKDFEKFYWPSFKKLVEALHEHGQCVSLFVEQDWTRFLDYLLDLPENTIMRFEYGDPKTIKQKLGHKHVLSGFYPATLLQTGTKEQCIDKAKELLEILAPGGRYIFDFDKNLLTVDADGLLARNSIAVLEYVSLNGNY
ncbi:MAG: uroporphyrinogen decarboxylase [Firmicutes bacterium]|jgi:hypothetical protein|nr:uroporphyrinogen decarboxylase [Bacillota bacterium]